jgi:hypothetical protein
MILPVPVKRGSEESDVEFEDLSKKQEFFKKLEDLFPKPKSRGMTKGFGEDSLSYGLEKLKVQTVGSFEASFAPTMKDMDRLDDRFKLPTNVWSQLPEYEDWGFVVFKLKSGDAERHPMAFSFSTRYPNKIYFPTVHVHHKSVPKSEEFDHELYAQGSIGLSGIFERSAQPLSFTERRWCPIFAEMHVHKASLKGEYTNEDTYIEV